MAQRATASTFAIGATLEERKLELMILGEVAQKIGARGLGLDETGLWAFASVAQVVLVGAERPDSDGIDDAERKKIHLGGDGAVAGAEEPLAGLALEPAVRFGFSAGCSHAEIRVCRSFLVYHPGMSDVRKKKRRWLRRTAAITTGLVLGWMAWGWVESTSHADAGQDGPAPIADPSSQVQPKSQLDQEAQTLLNTTLQRATNAYAIPMRVTGTLTGKFDVADQRDERSMTVHGSWARSADGQLKIRHLAEGEIELVNDGQRLWIMQPGSERYLSMPAQHMTQHNDTIALLTQQNPAVIIAALGDARKALLPPNATVTSCEAERGLVRIKSIEDGVAVDSLFDEATGFIVEMRTDFASHLASRGVTGIREAWATVRYEQHQRLENPPEDHFRFTPPPNAIEESIELPKSTSAQPEVTQ